MPVPTRVQPYVIDLEITNACPADCPMCPRDKLPSIGLMTEETFAKVLKFIDDSKKNIIVGFCGIGEPLLHPKIFDFIARLKQLEVKPHILIVTAGERLTPEVFEKLTELGVDTINLSLQTLEEGLYKKLMPGLKLGKVLKNIDYISENLNSRVNFTISFTMHKQNEHNVDEMLAFGQSKKIPVKVTKVHSRGGNMMDGSLIEPPPLGNANLTSCKIFETINFISWTGDIHPCCQDISRINKIGSVYNDSMNDMAVRKTGVLANGLKYQICSLCNDELRNNILTDKNLDQETQVKNDQKMFLDIYRRMGIFGENFLTDLLQYNEPKELLTHLDQILSDISHSINFLAYLRKRYPKLSVEVTNPEKNQLIEPKVLAVMEINPDNLAPEQIADIFAYLNSKYGILSEKLFEKIAQMPKQQIISMVYKHFGDARQLLEKDLQLMYLWKEKMAGKQLSVL
jgi:hypothetical protein